MRLPASACKSKCNQPCMVARFGWQRLGRRRLRGWALWWQPACIKLPHIVPPCSPSQTLLHSGDCFGNFPRLHCSPSLRSSLLPTMAAFGQALLLVGPHLTPERLQSQPLNRHLLMPFIVSASVVMAHHSPTRLASQLCPMLHSALEQLVSAVAEATYKSQGCTPVAEQCIRHWHQVLGKLFV